ncbi:MAG: hypothetical protein QM611_06775 [Microbacterium sp.]
MSERNLASNSGGPSARCLKLGVAPKKPRQAGGHCLPTAEEKGLLTPAHDDERGGDVYYGVQLGVPQEELIVFAKTTGYLLVDQPNCIEKGTTQEEGRGVKLSVTISKERGHWN